MLKIAFLLTGSGGVISLMRFGRNVLIARLIGVEDYGIASTFALLMTLTELLSDFGLGRFPIQDRDGDKPDFLAAVQSLSIVRGTMLAAVVLALADPIAALLGQPGLGWAYRILAVIPLLRSLAHFDVQRQQRAMRFGLMIKADFASTIGSLLAVAPLWLWLGDYRVMLGLIVLENAFRVGATHLIAERPYRLGWDHAVAARAMRFGWPLLAGGMLTFAVMQGERLIVANQYTATDLGIFSAALTLALAPTLVLLRIVNTMFLPLLARQQANEAAFLNRAELALELLLASGLSLMLVYVLVGPTALRLVYGPDFAAGALLVAILGISSSLRVVRSGCTSISMARGRTTNLLITNVVRALSFPAAVLVAIRGGSLEAIALTSVAGEAAALAAAYSIIAVRERLGPVLMRRAPLYALALVLALLLAAMAADLVAGPVPVTVVLVLLVVILGLCRRLRGYLAQELQHALQRS